MLENNRATDLKLLNQNPNKVMMANALNSSVNQFEIKPTGNRQKRDIEYFCAHSKSKVQQLLESTELAVFKYNLRLQVRLAKFKVETNEVTEIFPWFASQTKLHIHQSEFEIEDCIKEILQFYDAFVACGSGWTLDEVLQLNVQVYKNNSIGGGCMENALPPFIQRKKACISIKCSNDMCFVYCVLAHLNPKQTHPERAKQYETYFNQLNTTRLKFPVKLTNIPQFEADNNIRICVVGCEKRNLFPLYVSKEKADAVQIDLLLYKGHYYLIKDLSRLLSKSVSKNGHKVHFCRHCFAHFMSEVRLENHLSLCQQTTQKYSMPAPRTVLKYNNYEKQYKAPFVLYCDFETMIVRCNKDAGQSKSKKIAEHRPISFGVARVCTNSKYSKRPHIYRGENCVERFVSYIQDEYYTIQSILETETNALVWTAEDRKTHYAQTSCSLCYKKFDSSFQNKRCADHDHLVFHKTRSGEKSNYRSALCNTCNLKKAYLYDKVLVVFHNLKNYDSHLIIQQIYKTSASNLRVIPKNSEKVLSFQFDNFVFIDSYMFLSNSLDTLAKNLYEKGTENFSYTNQFFGSSHVEFMCTKGIMCYDYITAEHVFNETKLPSKSSFFNSLTNAHISNEEYVQANNMWQAFGCSNLGDYFDVYLTIDVCLLADVFENFRAVSHDYYGLDPVRYLSLPQYSFDCALKYTKIQLDLLHDIDMYNFCEEAIRGGICVAAYKLAKANNKYLKNYDPNERDSFIMYFDCNNLYGHAMCQSLPYAEFEWLTPDEMQQFSINKCDDQYGYFLQVDIEYPHELHDTHSEFPLACEKKQVRLQELSPITQKLAAKFKIKKELGCNKLVPNLHNKYSYITHYKNLLYYVEKGLIITKIHKILRFREKPWLKPYIEFNTEKRKQAENPFEKDLFKLMINSVFGKTMEAVKRRIDYRLVGQEKTLVKLASKPTFKHATIINSNLVGVEMRKSNITLNKPIYLGATILDLSKITTSRFYYDFLLPTFQHNVRVLYTDTDSFIISVFSPDIYADMSLRMDIFDTSNYAKGHALHTCKNKNVPGLWKDECQGRVINSFCALRPKMYSFALEGETHNKCKGVKQHVVKTMHHDEYLQCLENDIEREHEFVSIRSFKHKIYTVEQRKKSLSPMDDKRWYVTQTCSVALGHYLTNR